jgi:transglutaminase-like putative cysteine protease
MARASEIPQAQEQFEAEGGQSQAQISADSEILSTTDMAHRFIATVRALDIPARFVSGYLAAADGEPAAFHAWAEAYDDGLGWIGFDPALQLCPTERHIRVAVGLDALGAAPARAVPSEGPAESISVSVEVAQ